MIFAIDPSLTCTGFAVLSRDGEALIDCGTVTDDCPKNADAYERAKSLAEQVLDQLETAAKGKGGECPVSVVVVEAPRDNGAGLRGKRSAATAPNYGIAVGVMTYGVDLLRPGYGYELMRPTATEWTRGYPPTRQDKHKTARVRLVERLYQLDEGSLGPVSKAGNVADAVLLGRWAAMKLAGKEGLISHGVPC